MLKHEFGIIWSIEENKDYVTYEPEKYNCISIDDDIISDLLDKLKRLPTYYHSFRRPEFGLAYFGITLIPTPSFGYFEDILLEEIKLRGDYEIIQLLQLVKNAKEYMKPIIHFGI